MVKFVDKVVDTVVDVVKAPVELVDRATHATLCLSNASEEAVWFTVEKGCDGGGDPSNFLVPPGESETWRRNNLSRCKARAIDPNGGRVLAERDVAIGRSYVFNGSEFN